MTTKEIKYDAYALVPLTDLPFYGDWVLVHGKTGEVIWDSRKDGYDIPFEWAFGGSPLVKSIELVKDESVKEGAVYKITGVYEEDLKGE